MRMSEGQKSTEPSAPFFEFRRGIKVSHPRLQIEELLVVEARQARDDRADNQKATFFVHHEEGKGGSSQCLKEIGFAFTKSGFRLGSSFELA